MIIDIKEFVGKIDPINMIKFLQYRGWREVPVKADYNRAFQTLQDDKLYQIEVPISRDLSIFDTVMMMAVDTLAETMHMTANEIIWTLLA